jgi:plastin-1
MVAAEWIMPIHLEGSSAESEAEDMGRVRELLCSELFSYNHGLVLEKVEQAEFMDEERYGSTDMDKEEKTYCTWITSLLQSIEGTKPISHLIEDLRNGELLIKIVALITQDSPLAGEKVKGKSGIVEWKRISLDTTSRYKMGENVNYLLALCEQMGLNMINIGSADLLERNPKIVKSLLYRLMRWHSLSIVTRAVGQGAKNVSDVDESQVIDWVNQKIENSEEGSSEMVSFKDKENRNSVLFMDLLEAMKPGIVNWEIMRGIESEEDLMHNAKYVVSVARKMGATVFITWEDIVTVNKNMLLTFVCELMAIDKGLKMTGSLSLGDIKKK